MTLPDHIVWVANTPVQTSPSSPSSTDGFAQTTVKQVRAFHRTLPDYQPTPLVSLKRLANRLGLADITIKDESKRFGLKAFKALGASYGLCRTLKEILQLSRLDFNTFLKPENTERLAGITCITATDGNHGRAVAWTAQQLGCQAVVYMPKGSSQTRLENIRGHGADASIIDGNYDDAVQLASDQARLNRWLLVQDTARPDYMDIPLRIMQGYLTLFDEAYDECGDHPPTHTFVQCGVGSLAAALQGYLVQRFGARRPKLIVVEPTRAACFYLSALRGDGHRHIVRGPMPTLMAGLACGEPSILAWDILRDWADMFVACPDTITIRGMRLLSMPLADDPPIVSGESGAVTLGLVHAAMTDSALIDFKATLQLDSSSRVLLFSTEGDTDPARYKEITDPKSRDT